MLADKNIVVDGYGYVVFQMAPDSQDARQDLFRSDRQRRIPAGSTEDKFSAKYYTDYGIVHVP